jgi:hypothetical protein
MEIILDIYKQIAPYLDMVSAFCTSFIPILVAMIYAFKTKNAKQASEITKYLKDTNDLYTTDLTSKLDVIHTAASREQKIAIDYNKITEVIKAQDDKLAILASMLDKAFSETSIHPNTKTELHNMVKKLELGESASAIARLTEERDAWKNKYETVTANTTPVITETVVVEKPEIVEEVVTSTKRVRH